MRDYAYEVLAEVTSTDMNVGRGQLNAALKSIREQSEQTDNMELAREIRSYASLYRRVFPDMALTPTALAKHYVRVYEEAKQMQRGGVNLHVGEPSPMPPPRREANLSHARQILKMLSYDE